MASAVLLPEREGTLAEMPLYALLLHQQFEVPFAAPDRPMFPPWAIARLLLGTAEAIPRGRHSVPWAGV